MNRAWLDAIVIVTAVATGGCIADRASGVPLYPVTGAPLDASRVARLSGYVRYVDDQDVSRRGGVFDLLPGCHLIRTPTSWGKSSNMGAIVAATPELTFALLMRAGYQYSIELIADTPSGPSGDVDVKAFERDAQGKLVQTFGWAKSTQDLKHCASAAAEVEKGEPVSGPAATGAP